MPLLAIWQQCHVPDLMATSDNYCTVNVIPAVVLSGPQANDESSATSISIFTAADTCESWDVIVFNGGKSQSGLVRKSEKSQCKHKNLFFFYKQVGDLNNSKHQWGSVDYRYKGLCCS